MKTNHLRLVSHTHSVTVTTKSTVYSPYGPVKAGLTTWQRTAEDLVLMALLSSLEKKVANLNYKSSTVLDTLESVTKQMRAAHFDTTSEKGGTDV